MANDISQYRAGRPPGARNRFGKQALADLEDAWLQHGRRALDIIAIEDPSRFVAAALGLLPKDVLVKIEHSEDGPTMSSAERHKLIQMLDDWDEFQSWR